MKLTDRHAYTAKCPAGLNQADLRDDQVRGLFLRVYKSGVKTWGVFYRRRQDNRRRWLKLGTYPGLSLKQARDLAEIELGKVACGADPQSARVQVRTRPSTETFSEVAAEYLERYAKESKRPAGYRMDRWQLEVYVLPRWGKRPAAEVTRGDVQTLLEDLAAGTLAARGKPTKAAPQDLAALNGGRSPSSTGTPF